MLKEVSSQTTTSPAYARPSLDKYSSVFQELGASSIMFVFLAKKPVF